MSGGGWVAGVQGVSEPYTLLLAAGVVAWRSSLSTSSVSRRICKISLSGVTCEHNSESLGHVRVSGVLGVLRSTEAPK